FTLRPDLAEMTVDNFAVFSEITDAYDRHDYPVVMAYRVRFGTPFLGAGIDGLARLNHAARHLIRLLEVRNAFRDRAEQTDEMYRTLRTFFGDKNLSDVHNGLVADIEEQTNLRNGLLDRLKSQLASLF